MKSTLLFYWLEGSLSAVLVGSMVMLGIKVYEYFIIFKFLKFQK